MYMYIYIYMLYSRSFPTPLYLLDKHKLLCCSCIRILVRMVFERELVKGLPDPKCTKEKMPLKPVSLSLKCCTSLPSFSKVDWKKVLHMFFLVKITLPTKNRPIVSQNERIVSQPSMFQVLC